MPSNLHPETIHEPPAGDTVPTLLDGVSWPGFALLLVGVIALAMTPGDTWSGPWAAAAAIGLIAGVGWITVEHRRYLARHESPTAAMGTAGRTPTVTDRAPDRSASARGSLGGNRP
ncbi:hypothetical protein [Nocardia sp. NPDC046763]|uniref:hypothetical protein n=1 Tax=Nocardia sp. NPDC046763 TaxID=3155256 RepID=UPI0033F5A852